LEVDRIGTIYIKLQTLDYVSRAYDFVVWLWMEYSKVVITDFQISVAVYS